MKNSFYSVLGVMKEGLKMGEKENKNNTHIRPSLTKVKVDILTSRSSSRSVVVRDIAGVASKRPIPRTETLRGDVLYVYERQVARGFTLIELLVVVLIIGILAAVALPQYRVAVEKARTARLLPLVRSVYNANQVYQLANGNHTFDFTQLDIDLPAGGTLSSNNSVMTYPDYSLQLCEGCNSVIGSPNSSVSYYVEFYFNGSSYCWADKNSSLANAVCKSVSGRADIFFTSSVSKAYNLN